MRRWVEYDYFNDRTVEIDQYRLVKQAEIFSAACEEYKNEEGVLEIQNLYQPYVTSAKLRNIGQPIHGLPYTETMKERTLPEKLRSALNGFCDALEARPAIYGTLELDTFFNHKEFFIKNENGKYYILEHFDG